jgi:hypothetical protein
MVFIKKTELIPALWSNDDPENSEETNLWCILVFMRQVKPDCPCLIHELDVRHPNGWHCKMCKFLTTMLKYAHSFFRACPLLSILIDSNQNINLQEIIIKDVTVKLTIIKIDSNKNEERTGRW